MWPEARCRNRRWPAASVCRSGIPPGSPEGHGRRGAIRSRAQRRFRWWLRRTGRRRGRGTPGSRLRRSALGVPSPPAVKRPGLFRRGWPSPSVQDSSRSSLLTSPDLGAGPTIPATRSDAGTGRALSPCAHCKRVPAHRTDIRFWLHPQAEGFHPGLHAGVQRVLPRREVTNLTDDFVDSGQVEVDKGGHLRLLLQDFGGGVDEQGAGQRIGTVVDRLRRRGNALHREDVQTIGVLLVVCVAEVADGVGTDLNTLPPNVVVFADARGRGG